MSEWTWREAKSKTLSQVRGVSGRVDKERA